MSIIPGREHDELELIGLRLDGLDDGGEEECMPLEGVVVEILGLRCSSSRAPDGLDSKLARRGLRPAARVQ